MSEKAVNTHVRDLLEPLASDHGLELVATEVCGPKGHPVVRVYLDREGGIDLDTVTQANEWVSEALDAEPPVPGPYVLEVSSPGVDRPLARLDDFERFAGSRAVVKAIRPIGGRKSFTGTIEAVEDDDVVLDCDGERHVVPFEAIAKANLKTEITFGDE